MDFNLKHPKRYSCLLLLILIGSNLQASDFSFSRSGLDNWHEKSFSGYTSYQLIEDEGTNIVHAIADSSASGLFNQQSVDLEQTPILTWHWKVAQIGRHNNEQSKSGDDYPVRLYAIVKGEPYYWSNRILIYVWSNQAEIDDAWKNPFASEFRHITVETGERNVGQWRYYQRDIRADFSDVFGFVPKQIDAIAIMTDGDNSGQKFEAWYGDIEFKADVK